AGPGRPDPYPKASPAERDDLLHRAGARRSWREDGRLVALAREGEEVLGLIALVDPDGAAGDAQRARLEDGALVLAVELAHQREMAASELRLRGSLVDDLVAGVDPESARNRARSLGYDLERPHRVIVVQGTNRRGDGDLFHAVRRAARDTGVGSLLVSHGDVAVLLAHAEVPWEQLRDRVLAELGGGHCRLGVGGLGDEPGSFPRSYHEARLALALQESTGGVEQATDFDELGVYRLLSEVPERGTVRDFVDRWLGSLLAYDERKGSQLVETLGSYLDHGGNYDATAAARSLHRSTLRYRLQRIREVSGLDLHDPDTRFNLHLATRAWRTFDARQRI
ncbi:MAG: sugar diacid utilization regulator, partial [Acidimicrobiales bacterium]|nr:sugar diacid utilization regulator [Acidimicrobiales bacterium]